MRKSGFLVLPLLMAVVLSSFSSRASLVQSPQNLIVPPASETESTITLLWDRPCENDTSLLFLIYRDDKFIDSVKRTNYTVKNLAPDTESTFYIKSKNAKGEISMESNKVVHSTKKQGLVYNVTSYGAIGDGKTLNTKAIQKAIDACTPGGTVLIPEGNFLSGALFLKSNMTLHIADGGVLKGSTNPDNYLPMLKNRFEGWELESFASLLNAGELDRSGKYNITNLTIRGKGVIRGGGETLAKPIIEKFGLRSRGRLICLMNCNNVNIQGLTIENSPCWTIHYIYSKNITCHDLDISSTAENGDGIDPDSSTDSYIFNCTFNTGDDCIAIKSGKNPEGYYIGKPSKNIFISDCNFIDGHSIAIGSEMSGGVNNVVIRDCNSGNLRYGLQVKATKDRGGYVTGIKVSNCMLSRITVFTSVDYNNDGEPAPELPFIRDLEFTNIDMSKANTKEAVIFVDGFEGIGNYTGNIKFTNVTIPDNQTIRANYCKGLQFEDVRCVNNSIPVYKIKDSENVSFRSVSCEK